MTRIWCSFYGFRPKRGQSQKQPKMSGSTDKMRHMISMSGENAWGAALASCVKCPTKQPTRKNKLARSINPVGVFFKNKTPKNWHLEYLVKKDKKSSRQVWSQPSQKNKIHSPYPSYVAYKILEWENDLSSREYFLLPHNSPLLVLHFLNV